MDAAATDAEGELTTYGRQNKALQYAAADLADEVGWGWREKCGLTAARSGTAAWKDSPSSLEKSFRAAVPTFDSVGVPRQSPSVCPYCASHEWFKSVFNQWFSLHHLRRKAATDAEGELTTNGRQNKALQYAAADLTDRVGFGWREKCGLTAARSGKAVRNDSPSQLERSLRSAVPTFDSVGVLRLFSLCLSLLCLPFCLP